MTRRQRESLKLAMESMRLEMKPLSFDANVAMNDPNAPPMMQGRLKRYKQIVAAMQTIEEMIRGEQGELGI